MAEVMHETVETYSQIADPGDQSTYDGTWFEQVFREQMVIYGAYWRDDPEFDASNTRLAAPHLPCPEMDRLAADAACKVRHRLELRPGPRAEVPPRVRRPSPHGQAAGGPRSPRGRPAKSRYSGLEVDGPGGGQWNFWSTTAASWPPRTASARGRRRFTTST